MAVVATLFYILYIGFFLFYSGYSQCITKISIFSSSTSQHNYPNCWLLVWYILQKKQIADESHIFQDQNSNATLYQYTSFYWENVQKKFYNHFCSRNRFLTFMFEKVLLFESWNCRIFVETFLWCIFMFWRLKSGKQEVLGTPWTTAPNYGHFSLASQQELHHQPSTSNNGFSWLFLSFSSL